MISKSNKYLKQYSNYVVKYLYSQYKKRGVTINKDMLKIIQDSLEEEVIKVMGAAINSFLVVLMSGILKDKEFAGFIPLADAYDKDGEIDSKSSGYLLKMIKADKAIPDEFVFPIHTMLCSQIIDTKQIDTFLESIDKLIEDKNIKKRILTLGINNIFICCVWGHKVKYKDIDFDTPPNIIIPSPAPSKTPVN